MAQKIADRVRETTTTTGTGSIALAGAVTGYRSFSSVLSTGDTTSYCVSDQGGANWEVGIGTFTSPSTLARTTILSSSNSGSIVTFTTGSKDVFITEPAAALTAPIISGGTIDNSVIGGITPAAATVSSLTLGGYANNKKIFETANNYLTILNGNGADADFTIDTNGSAAVRGSLQIFSNLNINGVVSTGAWNGTAIAILYGGTGATTAAGARTNLGLGGAAVLNVGTTAGTVAAGDDSRIVGAEQTTNKGAANGYSGLDANSRILSSTLPNIPAVALALAGSLTSASHRNSEVFLSGTGALTVDLASYTTGTICVARNTTNAAVLISTNGYTTAQVGPPSYGFTSISPGGCATFLAGSSDGGTTTFLDVRGDLQ